MNTTYTHISEVLGIKRSHDPVTLFILFILGQVVPDQKGISCFHQMRKVNEKPVQHGSAKHSQEGCEQARGGALVQPYHLNGMRNPQSARRSTCTHTTLQDLWHVEFRHQ